MDESRHGDGVIPLAGRCLGLMARYTVLLVRYALLLALERLLGLPRS